MTCSRTTEFTKSDKIRLEISYIYMRLSWEQEQLICPLPFAVRRNRNPSSLFIEINSCYTAKLHGGASKKHLPRTDSTKGTWNRGYVLEGGSFGCRPNPWVARVRALAVLGIASPSPSGPKVFPAHILV